MLIPGNPSFGMKFVIEDMGEFKVVDLISHESRGLEVILEPLQVREANYEEYVNDLKDRGWVKHVTYENYEPVN
jgi:hypothetical protein